MNCAIIDFRHTIKWEEIESTNWFLFDSGSNQYSWNGDWFPLSFWEFSSSRPSLAGWCGRFEWKIYSFHFILANQKRESVSASIQMRQVEACGRAMWWSFKSREKIQAKSFCISLDIFVWILMWLLTIDAWKKPRNSFEQLIFVWSGCSWIEIGSVFLFFHPTNISLQNTNIQLSRNDDIERAQSAMREVLEFSKTMLTHQPTQLTSLFHAFTSHWVLSGWGWGLLRGGSSEWLSTFTKKKSFVKGIWIGMKTNTRRALYYFITDTTVM